MPARSRTYWLTLLLLLIAARGSAQGLIIFNNRVQNEVVAPIYHVEPAHPALPKLGNTMTGTPSGTQVYSGMPLAGANFTAQLFGGPTNMAVAQLVPLWPPAAFRSGDAAGFVVAPHTAVVVPGVSEGQCARVLLRAWENRGGTITNWSQVQNDPTIAHGESAPFVTLPLGSVLTPPPNIHGLRSFNLVTPVRLSSPRVNAQGGFEFDYMNATSIPYDLQSSINLLDWSHWRTIAPGTGTAAGDGLGMRRFYRVVPKP